ncbi:hypothetical protein EW145_g2667 [Phellinidium pouzarii]|uniref:Uncharacterized protein n=1 Tax=Phellinidium pouzarii TaxID=167371 RepID=A0A4S4L9Z9_9AGAM|nr:hypothetical protein EW145_g2667 [Phellinidium pouzarii]
MSSKPKHARRLSLFGLGSSPQPTLDELTPRPYMNASFSLPPIKTGKHPDDRDTSRKMQSNNNPSLSRKLSKKKKPLPPPPSPSTPASKNFSISSIQLADHGHEPGKRHGSSLSRKASINLKVAFTTMFSPKPSRSKVAGILHSVEGNAGGRPDDARADSEEKAYVYISRSPSPPSPEIRPPSGLGQIASSVDLSTYAQDEREGSLLASLSRSESRTPSVVLSVSSLPSPDATANTSLAHGPVKSIKSCSSFVESLYEPASQECATPSQKLIDVLQLSSLYCSPESLSCLACTCRTFLSTSRDSLYVSINSDDLHEDEKRRRRVLETLASNTEVASRVRRFRWVCLNMPASPSSSISAKRNIPRRAPNVSISSSLEEYILPRVLTLIPNIVALDLIQPPSSLLTALLPVAKTQRSPYSPPSSPSPQLQLQPPSFASLTSLALSGRTTLSTTFAAILVRILEMHPGISDLSLPDVFCLPILAPPRPSSSLSSSSNSSPIDGIPPVPPLPPFFSSVKGKDTSSMILPNLTRLTAPLTLATQLVPGRPLRVVDIELATTLYEGLQPIEAARFLAASESKTCRKKCASADWKAARQARRSGMGAAKGSTLRELRIRFGTELGGELEVLAIGWNGPENTLHAQLTHALARFQALQRLELFSTLSDSDVDEENDDAVGGDCGYRTASDTYDVPKRNSLGDIQAGIALEQRLVDHWARTCPQLAYMEFISSRVWKAR